MRALAGSSFLILASLLASFAALAKVRPNRLQRCDSLIVPLPVPSRTGDYDRDAFYRDGLLYLLATWAPEVTAKVTPSETRVEIPCALLPPAVQVALINAMAPNGSFDSIRFRNALGPVYLESRSNQHRTFAPPATLAEFKKLTNFENWPVEVVERSRLKDLTRAVYHSPANAPFGLAIAVTHESQTGDLNTAVRETEFLLRREDGSKNWDFYVYDATGKLIPQSQFGRSHQPSPGICMNCHYSSADRAFVPLMR